MYVFLVDVVLHRDVRDNNDPAFHALFHVDLLSKVHFQEGWQEHGGMASANYVYSLHPFRL
jgi:hypothetical protein